MAPVLNPDNITNKISSVLKYYLGTNDEENFPSETESIRDPSESESKMSD